MLLNKHGNKIFFLFLHNVGSPAQNEICCVWRRIENQQKRSIGQQLQTTYSSLFFLGTTDDEWDEIDLEIDVLHAVWEALIFE